MTKRNDIINEILDWPGMEDCTKSPKPGYITWEDGTEIPIKTGKDDEAKLWQNNVFAHRFSPKIDILEGGLLVFSPSDVMLDIAEYGIPAPQTPFSSPLICGQINKDVLESDLKRGKRKNKKDKLAVPIVLRIGNKYFVGGQRYQLVEITAEMEYIFMDDFGNKISKKSLQGVATSPHKRGIFIPFSQKEKLARAIKTTLKTSEKEKPFEQLAQSVRELIAEFNNRLLPLQHKLEELLSESLG